MTEMPHERQAEVTQGPPAHLAGALQAAAAARALAERIRNRDASLKSAHERREAEKSQTIPQEPRPSRPSRARTASSELCKDNRGGKARQSLHTGEWRVRSVALEPSRGGQRWALAQAMASSGVQAMRNTRRESEAAAPHSPADGAKLRCAGATGGGPFGNSRRGRAVSRRRRERRASRGHRTSSRPRSRRSSLQSSARRVSPGKGSWSGWRGPIAELARTGVPLGRSESRAAEQGRGCGQAVA